jgi:hypothetical protein
MFQELIKVDEQFQVVNAELKLFRDILPQH